MKLKSDVIAGKQWVRWAKGVPIQRRFKYLLSWELPSSIIIVTESRNLEGDRKKKDCPAAVNKLHCDGTSLYWYPLLSARNNILLFYYILLSYFFRLFCNSELLPIDFLLLFCSSFYFLEFFFIRFLFIFLYHLRKWKWKKKSSLKPTKWLAMSR